MFFPFAIDAERLTIWPFVTWILVAVNVLVFAATFHLSPLQQQWVVCQYGFLPARLGQRTTDGPMAVPVEFKGRDPDGKPLTLRGTVSLPPSTSRTAFSFFTYMFLHGSWMHLLGNVWFLWLFGRLIEEQLGHTHFLLFYLLGGVLAAVAHWAVIPSDMRPVVGASGAVAAILGAFAVLKPKAQVKTLVFLLVYFTDIELPALLLLTLWFVGQAVSGLGMFSGFSFLASAASNVAWWAHVGGFVAGIWIMLGWLRWKEGTPHASSHPAEN
ncbi:MAG: rhomboid family intramembrane serine protease [Planctomycetia bacterium]|nr:rhomboid family intramembrane serine protease [Planctomycetia bacterium]